MLRVIFSLAVALVIPCARMLSQDIRLSPEPTTTILSVDNRTVAAARIDSVTLIVWGTHIRGKAPNTVKNVLRTQIVRDTGLVDSSRILHSVAAYPSTYRKVFALHDRFLLLWDDRRSGTYELYAQVIDTTGRAVGEEVAIGEGMMDDASTFLLPMNGGWMLIWNSKNDTTRSYRQLLSSNGKRIGTAERLPTSLITHVLRYSEPDMVLLRSEKDFSVIMDASGKINQKLLPVGRLNPMFYLWPDSSLSILQDSTVIHYRNLLDDTPSNTTPILFPNNWLRGSETIGRDSAGELRILGWQKTIHSYAYIFTAMYPLRQAQQIQWYDTVSTNNYQSSSTSASSPAYKTTRYRLLCANNYVVDGIFSFSVYNNFEHNSYNVDYAVTYITSQDGTLYKANDPNIPSCYTTSNIAISRERIALVNNVKIYINKTARGFDLDSLINYRGDAIQILPAIVLRDNELLVRYWQGTIPYMYFPQNTFLGQWRNFQDTLSGFKDDAALSVLDRGWMYAYRITNANTFFLACRDDIRFIYRGQLEAIATNAVNYVPTNEGWRPTRSWITKGHHTYRRVLASGFNPVRNELIIIDHYEGNPPRSYATINSRGDSIAGKNFSDSVMLTWEFHNDLVPIDSTAFLLFNPDKTLLFQDSKISFINDYVVPKGNVRLQRLIDDSFLEIYSEDSLTIRLRIFSLVGKLRYEKTLNYEGKSPFVVGQSPTTKDIFLLRGGNDGVKLTMMNSQLKNLVDGGSGMPIFDIPISTTRDSVGMVSGVFRNDTLFAVWEDFRNSFDIYGTAWKRPSDLIAPGFTPPSLDTAIPPNPPFFDSTENSTFAIMGIIPTPADNFLSFQLQLLKQGVVTLHVVDALGKIVKRKQWRAQQRVQNIFLETQDLFPGAYTALFEVGGHFQSRQFLVVH
ncbi:MAG: hypothetical protein UZ07_CHB004000774 [Chlorobi bacterium OLB7]|nr:MAG: hypothetical protein UZ07_CHB004000774 [Chlorobi bacterium OLB7]